MAWWGWIVVMFAGLLGAAAGWSLAVMCQAILSESHDVWGDEDW